MGNPLEDLEERIDYGFKDRALLVKALTHSSYANECRVDKGDNEQLEFLGDSIIGFVVSEYLLANHPHLSEGQLSKLKAISSVPAVCFARPPAWNWAAFSTWVKEKRKTAAAENRLYWWMPPRPWWLPYTWMEGWMRPGGLC